MAASTGVSLWQAIKERGVHAAVAALTAEESVALTNQNGTHNYKPLPVNIARGDGAILWDSDGKEYIDCLGAYSAVSHGHLSPTVVRAIREQLELVTMTSRAYYTSEVALFLHAVAEFCELDMVCPMNSGAEAIETCIKLIRKWAYTVKGVPDDQAEIIVFQDNFHGRTTTIVGFSTEEGYKRHFGPFTPGFKVVPFGDIDALKAAITPNTAAVLGEPIQAEGGILIPPDGYLAEVRRLCTANNVLLCWDEIQCGLYRTGKKFSWMYEDAKPDIMAVGKALGGGVLPVSAAVGTKEVMEVFKPGDHGSTFGGNPLGSVVALAALAEMETSGFGERVTRLGKTAHDFLTAMPFKQVKEVRARGLLIGVEVDETVDIAALTDQLLANGLLTKQTRQRTYRLTPPLVITDDQLMEALRRFERSLAAVLD
ncbi:MAG: ornithine--oxo-acid transaminase [Fimbriimonadaceae bacterium]|nr:ornithine--oxo-acid transaminase [Fimbriimonadaceae bacterium]